ncbi:SulP family inorganic anion transporter [Fischerella sp. PCC 9605]|uniref:SulP family inorganic anion transporter n=1 Tax=Fischerella sp. PCC 9605 TaxID=1173024 RepID=UPI00054E391C|nr:solute carrier family 26 protein [Fischerella sp. PCC 9605]
MRMNRRPTAVRAFSPAKVTGIRRYLPFLEWLLNYHPQDLVGDLMAGMIVAIMLVPQSMAYALLAGLPPQVGLYASILPLILYALFGTSRTLAVGPVAMVSLLVATGIGAIAPQNSPEYIVLALVLALLVGIIQLSMGLFRLGFLVNFLSHAVISGFTSAAALIIAFSQLKHLLGVKIPHTESFYELLISLVQQIDQTNIVTLSIGVINIAVLIYFNKRLGYLLNGWGIYEGLIVTITKSAPLIVVLFSTLLVWGLALHENANVNIVGAIPRGLPPLTLPSFEWTLWQKLLPTALTISFVGFMESIAVAKSLASKRRQKVDANQELIGLGAANLGAAVTGGYPVTGGFSRSVVNFAAGANTALASMIAALLIALVTLFFTPVFYFLPQTTLAAIIIVAVFGLVDVNTFKQMWRYNKADGVSLLITFVAVLAVGIEFGILVGVVTAVLLFLWRTSRPHIAIVGRVGESETFRNILRYEVKTCPHVLAIRVDGSLYFANTKYLEDQLLQAIAQWPKLEHLVLVCSAINFIDASALETLENLMDELKQAGVNFYLAEVKGPVMDRLSKTDFLDQLDRDRIFLSTHQAMQVLGCNSIQT